MILDQNGRLSATNRMFRETFCRGEDPGAPPLEDFCGGIFAGPGILSVFKGAWVSGRGRCLLPAGSCTYEMQASLADTGGGSLVVSLIDISRRQDADELIGRINRQIGTINGIIRACTSPASLADTLGAVVQKTVELMDFDAGAIYLVDRTGGCAALRADFGLYRLYFAETLCSGGEHGEWWDSIFGGCRPCYGEAYLSVEHEEGELGVYSCAVVPVVIPGGGVIGALAIASSNFHQFTPLEKETLEAIGQETGGIIHKTALIEDLASAKAGAEFYLDVMAHDINNANNVAMGYLELLREDLEGEAEEYATRCLNSIRQSCTIIDEVRLLRTCDETTHALVPVPLAPAIESALASAAGAWITWTGSDAVVLADELLGQVFVNLLGNSLKFGGADVAVEISALNQGGLVSVRIADNGPGIPDDAKAKIFDRFYRSNPSVPGRGMGLYIASMLVGRYGGEIRVEDRVAGRPEEGAAFVVLLKEGA
ncbi:GAF domain-containing sensor histidine kinase [Methanofollis fontis]|nr:GAF domain-containing sensor histidine kinase [Methanofollis fontis]